MKKTLQEKQTQKYTSLLRQGDERGLDFFYHRLYGYLFARAFRATKDDCASQSIAQEALFRLWLFRAKVNGIEDILTFLKTQVRSAIRDFYTKSNNRFHRSLLRLDGIEDYQEFLHSYAMEDEVAMDVIYLDEIDEEKKQRLDKLRNLLPNLNQKQQLFIELCLKYSFNYGRIAYYLGGISDYEVSRQVEKTIDTLRAILNSSQKMELMNGPAKIVLQGEFDGQQAEIFHMRYELQLSFEQISKELNLSPAAVKKLFVQAHARIKTGKKTA
jgi:RNA polymerase sigma factor (sigma-70 family)